jgi:pimeloyl-ACP methyl ester carboxylesterase
MRLKIGDDLKMGKRIKHIFSNNNHSTVTVLGSKPNLYVACISELEYLHRVRKVRGSTSSILITIFLVTVIITLPTIITSTANRVYGQPDPMNLTVADSSPNIHNIPSKKVQVGDIEIAYKMLGKGDPILLISPAQADMNAWEPSTLSELSSNHTVIVFDNRGVGNTTTGNRPFSIQQFANDTAGLLDALKIQKADILGYSLGSFVAQQLAVTHPDKVNRLMLVAASCGGKDSIPHSPELPKMVIDVVNRIANDTLVTREEVKALLSQGLGSGWLELHPNFLESIPIPEAKDLFPSITPQNNLQQLKAGEDWMAANWSGVCDELTDISIPTLIITGTDDTNVPTQNSLIIAGKIPGAWLIQIENAGHSLPGQYPDKMNKILQTFLSTTNTTTTVQPE